MREQVDLEPRFPAPVRTCMLSVLEHIDPSEAALALRRDERDPGNLEGLIAARVRGRLPPSWRLRMRERVAQGSKFANDFSLIGAGGVVSVEVEKGRRGRFDLDLIKMAVFAARHFPVPAFGVLIVSLREALPRDVTGSRHETPFAYLRRTLTLMWQSHRGNLEDVLVIGCDEGEGAELALPDIPPSSGERPPSEGPDIVEGTQGLDLDEIARMVGGTREEVFRSSPALRDIRRALLQGRAGVVERLNRGPIKYLGYHAQGRDRAYVYVQSGRLVVDVDVLRTEENLHPLREAGVDVVERHNFQWSAGWVTGILLPHSAPPEQTAVVVEAIVRALTRDGEGGLFPEPGG